MNPQYHQREMEQRIKRFDSECVAAVHHIGLLQEQARSFLRHLSSEQKDFKNLFLHYTRQIDQFLYAVTEFNLAASTLENDASAKTDRPKNFNHGHKEISSSRSNMQQLPSKGKKYNNTRDKGRSKTTQKEKCRERNVDIVENVSTGQKEDLTNTGCPVGLPPQPKLDPEAEYEATIVAVDGTQLWMVVDDNALFKLIEEMNHYYKNQKMDENYVPESICAYYDEMDTMAFLRAIYITPEEGDAEVFLVDTGEFQTAVQNRLYPLAPQFALIPPLANLFTLAEVNQTEDRNLEDRRTELLKQFLGRRYKIKLVDDAGYNQLQCLGVYVFLADGTILNERLERALASDDPELNNNIKTIIIDESRTLYNNHEIINTGSNDEIFNTSVINNEINDNHVDEIIDASILDATVNDKTVNNEGRKIDQDIMHLDVLDNSKCPEYENVVEAVTGYSNKDEIDICKHYKDGDGCFKGSRCKKRHVKIHPDGWTLDRVPVVVKCRPAALPAPGTWHKVKVTHVDDTCLFYVHFECPEEPMSLAELVEEMTLAAEDSRPLPLEPAPGELVSARFSDNRYYRARVLAVDDKIEVMYIDYGNTAAVSPDHLRPLQPRWLALPVRAAPSRLAGVPGHSDPEAFKQLLLDRTVEALVIARDYDELVLKLVDADGFDVGEQLAAFSGVVLQPYDVQHDSERRCHLVPA